ncbi:MAG: hypothetical protein JW834_04990 [Candidatus Diapherotrites archaeon]|nr:hypothetical protein [Candidatus Diapherotrites archaeon]
MRGITFTLGLAMVGLTILSLASMFSSAAVHQSPIASVHADRVGDMYANAEHEVRRLFEATETVNATNEGASITFVDDTSLRHSSFSAEVEAYASFLDQYVEGVSIASNATDPPVLSVPEYNMTYDATTAGGIALSVPLTELDEYRTYILVSGNLTGASEDAEYGSDFIADITVMGGVGSFEFHDGLSASGNSSFHVENTGGNITILINPEGVSVSGLPDSALATTTLAMKEDRDAQLNAGVQITAQLLNTAKSKQANVWGS